MQYSDSLSLHLENANSLKPVACEMTERSLTYREIL